MSKGKLQYMLRNKLDNKDRNAHQHDIFIR